MAVLGETPPDLWREVMRINLDSVYFLCHGALNAFLKRGGGSIVNISSGGGIRGMNDAHTYATAKAGVINMTRSMARAYGPKNIRCNVVAPGFVDTEMVSPVLDSDFNPFNDEAQRYQVSPLGRPGPAGRGCVGDLLSRGRRHVLQRRGAGRGRGLARVRSHSIRRSDETVFEECRGFRRRPRASVRRLCRSDAGSRRCAAASERSSRPTNPAARGRRNDRPEYWQSFLQKFRTTTLPFKPERLTTLPSSVPILRSLAIGGF